MYLRWRWFIMVVIVHRHATSLPVSQVGWSLFCQWTGNFVHVQWCSVALLMEWWITGPEKLYWNVWIRCWYTRSWCLQRVAVPKRCLRLQFLTFVRKWDGVIGDFNTAILLIFSVSELRKYQSQHPRVNFRVEVACSANTRDKRKLEVHLEIVLWSDSIISVSSLGQDPPRDVTRVDE